jgi:hypothetical protein
MQVGRVILLVAHPVQFELEVTHVEHYGAQAIILFIFNF